MIILGVEKNNDDAKRHYYSGNRHNASRDILTEARIEHLERESPSCVREKRSYVKRSRDYWESDILEQGDLKGHLYHMRSKSELSLL